MYIRIIVYMSICKDVYMYIYIHQCINVCRHKCTYVEMYNVYVYTYVYKYIFMLRMGRNWQQISHQPNPGRAKRFSPGKTAKVVEGGPS